MACGTPVIAFGLGSMPEIIRNGLNGYIVDDVDAAVEAVTSARSLDRSACRQDTVERFSSDRMARDYISAYEQILRTRS